MAPQGLDALVADPASRHVDDPLEADRVGVRAQHPQVCQRVLDLAPLVEPRAADQLVADAVAEERLLDRAGLAVHPVHDRDVPGTEAGRLVVIRAPGEPGAATRRPHQPLDLAGDPLGLLLLVIGLEPLDRHAALVVRPELLVGAPLVARHDRVGGVEDELRGAVVLLQLDHRGVGVVALEVEDVLDVGAAPAVDRLVVVAHHAQVAVRRGQEAHPQVLRPVGVLVLVHVEVAPARLVALEHLGRCVEQLDRLEQQVVEVERAGGPEPLVVAREQLGDDALAVGRGVLGEEVGVEHVVLGAADGAQDRGRPELPGRGQVLLGEDPLHQLLLVVGVVDDEAPVEADRLAVAAEDAGAQGVERARLHVLAAIAHERGDPLPELARRSVGERDGQDPTRLHGLNADEVRDAVGDDARLARAGAGEDEQRAVGGGDRPGLLGVEVADDLLRTGLAAGGHGGGDRLGVERGTGRLEDGVGGELAEPLGLVRDRAGRGRRRLVRRGTRLVAHAEVEPRALVDGLVGTRSSAARLAACRGGTHRVIVGGAARGTLAGGTGHAPRRITRRVGPG